MKPTIYLPIWFLKILDEETRRKILDVQYLSKSSFYGYTGNEFQFKLLEDDHYFNCSEQFKKIYETEDKLLEQEKELKHLREIKASVDQIRKIFK